MAPWRRKGAKGANATSELSLGDLVLAKVKGYPFWPAKISRPEDWKRVPDPKKYFVHFFGTNEIAFVGPTEIQAFTSETKEKVSAKCEGKAVKEYFALAVEEICKAFEELQKKKSSGPTIEVDRSASESSSVPQNDGLETEVAENMSKIETGKDGEYEAGLQVNDYSAKSQGDTGNELVTPKACNDDVSCVNHEEKPYNKSLTNGHKSEKSVARPNMKVEHVAKPKKHMSSSKGTSRKLETNNHVIEHDNDKKPKALPKPNDAEECSKRQTKDQEPESEKDVDHELRKRKMVSNEKSYPTKRLKARETVETNIKVSPQAIKKSNAGSLKVVEKKANESELISSRGIKKSSTGNQKGLERKVNELEPMSPQGIKKSSTGNHKVLEKKENESESKRSASHIKTVSKPSGMQANHISSKLARTEDSVPSGKHHQRMLEALSNSPAAKEGTQTKSTSLSLKDDVSHSKKVKSPVNKVQAKRRAVRLDEDDEEEPKTPVHVAKKNQSSHLFSRDTVEVRNKIPVCDQPGRKVSTGIDNALLKDSAKLHCESSVTNPEQSGVQRHEGPFQSHEKPESDMPISKQPNLLFASPDKSFTDQSAKKSLIRTPKMIPVCDQPGHNVSTGNDRVLLKESTTNPEQSGVQVKEDPSQSHQKPKSDRPFPKQPNIVFASPEKSLYRTPASHVSCSPGKVESKTMVSDVSMPGSDSPKVSSQSGVMVKTVLEMEKSSKPAVKVPQLGARKKIETVFRKPTGVVSDGLNSSPSQAGIHRSKTSCTGERLQNTPKSVTQVSDLTVLPGSMMDDLHFSGERSEAGRDDKSGFSVDGKVADSTFSMKDLIAVAQKKRRQSHSQHLVHGNTCSISTTLADVPAINPSPSNKPLSGAKNLVLPDTRMSTTSPYHDEFPPNDEPEISQHEKRRVISESKLAGDSLSGGTEATVSRDAFEGMIETLSRTKESIGRATRLAIDCAKYGVASEIIELLIRKLESEIRYHRKVDLLFLVDSITQCSHNHKGIAGASYIPAVQASLRHLVRAAAPPGAAGRENRRQCLKVLRLWLERRILPEPLIRQYIDEIVLSNDNTPAGSFPGRPSRAERAVDDPIREMEGMLVDEYGSNATFQLPGFFPSRVFEEDEDDEIPTTSLAKETGNAEPMKNTFDATESETYTFTPNDRRQYILEDVEMEDVSGHPRNDNSTSSSVDDSFITPSLKEGSDRILEEGTVNLSLSPQSSPPLPLDSPPLTPPLPLSPPPESPPPLPSYPSSPQPPSQPPPPPPPPPPPVQHVILPPHSGLTSSFLDQASLPPEVSSLPLQYHQMKASNPSPPTLSYQQLLLLTNANQLVHMSANNTSHGGQIDSVGRSDIFSQQSHEAAAGVVDYGLYSHSQASQQYQPIDIPPFMQRHPPPPPPPIHQNLSAHFSYTTSTIHQHPFPRPYSLLNLPDGPRQYVIPAKKRRRQTNEFNLDSQRGLWMNGGSRPSSYQEGYFGSSNNAGFQHTGSSTLPVAAPVQGPGVPQMLGTSRPDMSSLNCWRPA
ncbi:ENHANCER OF AG-4 protein 2-like [Impatiens glandulifera]|uniref:ENHANCER OF AG-4 protein 2-like n=1 Tax=Impatiens glandulifera TaxID=253017 RepID=UPI001FB0D294|nr:ENHANCER OF AG-4 protein 2-like [Impatiens glandulifera]